MKLTRRQTLAAAATCLLTPAVQAAAARVTLAGIEFDPTDSAALKQPAGPDTQRIFLRKGPWAVIWYVQAKSPVDGKAFDVVVVERQRWTGLTAARAAVDYTATVLGKKLALKGHGDFQRWVMTSRDWPLSDRWLDDWTKKGWLLPWGIGPKLKALTNWPWMYDVPAYQPLKRNGITDTMGATGLRDDIGPIMQRQARYIIERSADMRAISLSHGLSMASIPWHVRGQDGAALLLDRPNTDMALQQYYQNLATEKIIQMSPAMREPWLVDNSHRPCGALLPALLSGLHPFFVEEQVFSACAALNTVSPSDRGPASLLLDAGQGRDLCWSLRDILLAYALLTRLPPLPWLPSPARFATILSANLDRALGGMATPGMGSFGICWGHKLSDAKPIMAYWAPQQTGGADGTYIGAIPDFLGYCLDWGRRLTGDPRWLKLQLQFAERFQAARVLALGPYAFQYLPVRLAGRWGRDWAEVAQRLKIKSLPRWHSFDLPINDKALYPYSTEYPLNLYHSLKLAAATGAAGPVVAKAISYLEAQMQPGAVEMWPAFALRHSA